nr:hypothetical protein [Clostridia bacterium]
MRKMMLLMLAMLCLLLTGCTTDVPAILFDPETEGAVDVIVRDGDALAYYAVSGDGRVQETAAFTGDDVTVYSSEVWHIEIFDENGQVDVSLMDESGAPVENTPEINAVLRAAGVIDNWIMHCRVIEADGAYFLYVELNVNWWDPCELYWYDPVRDGLVKLCSFNGWETVGLRVRELSGLSELPLYAP